MRFWSELCRSAHDSCDAVDRRHYDNLDHVRPLMSWSRKFDDPSRCRKQAAANPKGCRQLYLGAARQGIRSRALAIRDEDADRRGGSRWDCHAGPDCNAAGSEPRQGGSGDRFAAQTNEGLQDRQMNRIGPRTIFALLLIDTATRIWGCSATLTS